MLGKIRGILFFWGCIVSFKFYLANLAVFGFNQRQSLYSIIFSLFPDLKRLELRNLEKMPKITDTIFSLVFRHMKLTHFIIQSDEPITKVIFHMYCQFDTYFKVSTEHRVLKMLNLLICR